MLLTIDVGNTNMVLGVFEGEEVVEHWRIATDPARTADELAVVLQGLIGQSPVLKDPDIDGIALCSTVPSVLHEMREMFQRYYGDVPALIVEPGVRTGVSVRMDNPKEVGSDRIMNTVAAVHLYGGRGPGVGDRHRDRRAGPSRPQRDHRDRRARAMADADRPAPGVRAQYRRACPVDLCRRERLS